MEGQNFIENFLWFLVSRFFEIRQLMLLKKLFFGQGILLHIFLKNQDIVLKFIQKLFQKIENPSKIIY